jgi:hypothetical protein
VKKSSVIILAAIIIFLTIYFPTRWISGFVKSSSTVIPSAADKPFQSAATSAVKPVPASTLTPASTLKSANPTTSTPGIAEQAAIRESQEVAKVLSENILSGNTEKVLNLLEASARLQISSLDLNSPQAKSLATAVSTGKVVQAFPSMVIYESILGSEHITFYFIKEEGTWKLAGF